MPSEDPSKGAAPPVHTRLTGWKEIATFFGKGVRTVQRWEKDVDLPVHRINTGGGEGVYALVAELERWQATAAGRAAAREPAEAGNGGGQPEPALAPSVGTTDQRAQPSVTRRRKWPWVVAGAVVATAVIGGILTYRRHAPTPTVDQPAQYKIEGNRLAIFDRAGRFLWDYPFEFPLAKEPNSTSWARDRAHEPVVFHDIDGDEQAEVLFTHDQRLVSVTAVCLLAGVGDGAPTACARVRFLVLPAGQDSRAARRWRNIAG